MNDSRWWARAGFGLAESDFRIHRRVERTMHGDEIFVADYLIQFDVMDMSGGAAFRSHA